MRERKVWNEEEDRILRYLKVERGEKKWSAIARKMEEEFNIKGRTGKQCRQRYHNHLDAEIVRTEWTEGEDELLYSLHEEYGNKWSSIAQKLPGRSDNCVKNHFYSKLRKSVRRLNKFISEHLQKEYEQISPRLLSKIIEYSESRFKSSVRVEEETIDYSIHLKNRLYKFENECDEAMDNQEDIEIAHHLIEDIFFFEKNNKKPGKLIRKRTNSFDNQQFLHPRACVRANRSNSNLSDLSDQSEDHSGCSSSYGDSYEEEEVTKPRKRSLTTTRSSKDVSSRNNSQIMEVKLETRSNNAKSETKQEMEDKMVDFDMPIMDLEKLSISLIEDHSYLSMDGSERPSRRASIESRNSKSSDNRSSGSNRRQRTTFDAFCQLDDKIGFNWPNHFNQDPVSEGNEIIWRIIQPKEPTKTNLPIDDDDEPIQPDGMDEQF